MGARPKNELSRVGLLLQEAQDLAQITVEEQAKVIGIAYNTYKDVKYGRRRASRPVMLKLASYFGVSLERLAAHMVKGSPLVDGDAPASTP